MYASGIRLASFNKKKPKKHLFCYRLEFAKLIAFSNTITLCVCMIVIRRPPLLTTKPI